MAQPLPSGSLKKTNPTVSRGVSVRTWVFAQDLDLADLHAAFDELGACFVDVFDHQLQALSEPGGMSGTTPFPTTIEQPDPGGVSRQMYGRAGLPLLRKRVLLTAAGGSRAGKRAR